MKITTTTTERRHDFTNLTDDELLVIERALFNSESVRVGQADDVTLWGKVNDAVYDADLRPYRD